MKTKVFITKYALSSGVMECEMEVTEKTKCYGKPDGFDYNMFFFGDEFHLTKEEAILDCEKRKEKKVISLEKQLLKIKKMSF